VISIVRLVGDPIVRGLAYELSAEHCPNNLVLLQEFFEPMNVIKSINDVGFLNKR
jgi:hypothetical protein